MVTCHLTNQQNHSLQLHHEIFPHFFLSPSSCLLSSMSCVHLGYKTHLAHTGEQLGKQTKKTQTSTFPNNSEILEAAATSNTPPGVTLGKKTHNFLFYKNTPCAQTGLQLQSISIINFINTGQHYSGKKLPSSPKLCICPWRKIPVL